MAVAAYAAVLSLIHVLDQIQHPAWRRLHLDRDRIETLREKVNFLQDFLELYSQLKSREIEDLAMQISDVAVEAENVIDTHVVDQLRAISADNNGRALSLFCEDIDGAIEKIDSIRKELMVFKEGMAGQEQQPGVPVPAVSTAPPSSGKNTMVGFDEHLVRIMEVLTGDKSDRQILPIVGMGGIGKTTLARNVFDNPCIVYHFHIRVWITISQDYSIEKILFGLLQDMGVENLAELEEQLHKSLSDMGVHDGQKNKKGIEDLAYQLGEQLHKSLSGRRYLIVMDDLWSTEAWNDLELFFPDNRNGSRILVTTRLSNVAASLGSHNPYLMDFLDEDQSWNLLREKAFAQKGCPPELEKIGKNVAKSCKGLPLAIVVIGGLLSNSVMETENWEFVAEHVNLFANSENDEYCLKILSLSYNNLPIHLKPCFLYMGVFSEDDEIQVSELIKSWVAQGFLKPKVGKSLEEVAREYLKDLIDRNLILIRKWTHIGKIKTCSIHDLLRDLCIREFYREHFLRVPKMQKTCTSKYEGTCFLCNSPHAWTRTYLSRVIVASRATSPSSCSVCHICRSMYPQLNAVRLVRVIDEVVVPLSDTFPDNMFSEEILHPTKLRYFSLKVRNAFEFVSTSMPLLWNLQTVFIQRHDGEPTILPSEIWEMPQLRHIIIDEAIIPDPVVTQIDRTDSTMILENLQTLSTISNFRCSKEVLERIPNLTKLKIDDGIRGDMGLSYSSLDNFAHLHKLESLYLKRSQIRYADMLVFPHSLKRLILTLCSLFWKQLKIIGYLPNLEVLKLYHVLTGLKWNPVEGEFLKLKLLLIEDSYLECWGAEKVHFPKLESLVLRNMHCLKEIPSGVGEIETLRLIDLSHCSESVVDSARKILEEQENLGIEDLQLLVRDTYERPQHSSRRSSIWLASLDGDGPSALIEEADNDEV